MFDVYFDIFGDCNITLSESKKNTILDQPKLQSFGNYLTDFWLGFWSGLLVWFCFCLFVFPQADLSLVIKLGFFFKLNVTC